MAYSKITVNVCNGISILKHMHILQSFCIAMFLSLFRHNKTPKVFCLTFGVHVSGPASLLSELEVVVCVIVGDVFYHLMDEVHLADRELSVLQVFAYEVAEDPAEILVARIGKETA